MKRRRAPPLVGIKRWINCESIDLADLEGKAVVIYFWSYINIHCDRDLAKLKQLYEHYKGLVEFVGVHTSRYNFETSEQVERYVKENEISWPIAVDFERQSWDAYQVSTKPRYFIIDKEGYLVWDVGGEGQAFILEQQLRDVLGDELPSAVFSKSTERDHSLTTPRTMCGKSNMAALGSTLIDGKYDAPKDRSPGFLYPQGSWEQDVDCLRTTGDDGAIALQYTGKEANLVMDVSEEQDVVVELDLKAVPETMRGKDTFEKDGVTYVHVDHPGIYKLISCNQVVHHELILRSKKPGLELFRYTFG